MPIRVRHRKRPKFVEPTPGPPALTLRLGGAISDAISTLWLPILIFLIPLLCYWPVLQSGFVSDDYFPHAMFNWSLNDFIEKLALIHAGELEFPFFRPLAIAAFKLDYFIWGADAVGFHMTNLLLHSVNAVLLFFLIRSIGISRLGAAVGALFFGLYPASPEAVTWVSGRFDLLAMTFLLIAFLSWCTARLRNNVWWMIPSVVAFFLAILSK